MSIQPGRIRQEINLRHAPDKVWRILTEPDLVAKWWAVCDIVPEVGRDFQFDMGKWGIARCKVVAVEPRQKLSYIFGSGGLDTTITWTLRPEGEGTVLELVQDGFDLDSPLAKAAFEGMSSGWPVVLEKLAKALEA